MATMAMLMSVRIMKDTRKPVKDSMYSTTRAGTPSVQSRRVSVQTETS